MFTNQYTRVKVRVPHDLTVLGNIIETLNKIHYEIRILKYVETVQNVIFYFFFFFDDLLTHSAAENMKTIIYVFYKLNTLNLYSGSYNTQLQAHL